MSHLFLATQEVKEERRKGKEEIIESRSSYIKTSDWGKEKGKLLNNTLSNDQNQNPKPFQVRIHFK